VVAELQIGDKVSAIYKTGKYLGEITDIRPQHYLVRVLGVARHPMQGDIHNPKEISDVFFHERRALAYREQTNVPKQMVKPYSEDIPEYSETLKQAVKKIKAELIEDPSPWAEKSLQQIEALEKDYFK
jgi:kinase-associated protein B